MAECYEIFQITVDGAPTGKFRRTVRADDPISGPFGLCDHYHDNKAEADYCPDALSKMPESMRPQTAEQRIEEAMQDLCGRTITFLQVEKAQLVLLTKKEGEIRIWSVGSNLDDENLLEEVSGCRLPQK